MKGFPPNHLFLNTKVESVQNTQDGRVELHTEGGRVDVYDHVILATHGDQAYEITQASATDEEKSILSCFKTSDNEAVLHSDLNLMPRCEEAWSSWNYVTKSAANGKRNVDQVSLTYNMNILQSIPREIFGDVLVTLNPLYEPDASTVQGRFKYRHPMYTAAAVRAQNHLSSIQNTRGISYCGAWTKYGFHEDGFSSGLKVAQDHLGARIPFVYKDSTYSRGDKPEFTLVDFMLRFIITFIQAILIIPMERIFGVDRRRALLLTNGVNGVNGHREKED